MQWCFVGTGEVKQCGYCICQSFCVSVEEARHIHKGDRLKKWKGALNFDASQIGASLPVSKICCDSFNGGRFGANHLISAKQESNSEWGWASIISAIGELNRAAGGWLCTTSFRKQGVTDDCVNECTFPNTYNNSIKLSWDTRTYLRLQGVLPPLCFHAQCLLSVGDLFVPSNARMHMESPSPNLCVSSPEQHYYLTYAKPMVDTSSMSKYGDPVEIELGKWISQLLFLYCIAHVGILSSSMGPSIENPCFWSEPRTCAHLAVSAAKPRNEALNSTWPIKFLTVFQKGPFKPFTGSHLQLWCWLIGVNWADNTIISWNLNWFSWEPIRSTPSVRNCAVNADILRRSRDGTKHNSINNKSQHIIWNTFIRLQQYFQLWTCTK